MKEVQHSNTSSLKSSEYFHLASFFGVGVLIMAPGQTDSVCFYSHPTWDKATLDEWFESCPRKMKVDRSQLNGSGLVIKYVDTLNLGTSIQNHLKTWSSQVKGKSFARGTDLELYILGDKGTIRVAEIQDSAKVAKDDGRKRRIMIVDDSKTIRSLLKKSMNDSGRFEVVAETGDPREVKDLIKKHSPDAMTLDIHMPEMTGVDVLKMMKTEKIQVPTIVVSSLSISEGTLVIEALELGAVDYIQKPEASQSAEFKQTLVDKLLVASAQKNKKVVVRGRAGGLAPKSSGPVDLSRLVAIGASTGGTEAIKVVLGGLPSEIPPILIVQHIPPFFSKAFADRLNEICPFDVKEAEDGDEVRPGRVIVAPGGLQMQLKKSGGRRTVKVFDGDLVSGHKPSVDVLFQSVADVEADNALGVILTGMGKDGATGMKQMFDSGAYTIGQDESSCVVYGMPKAAFALGGVTKQMELGDISREMLAKLSKQRKTA